MEVGTEELTRTLAQQVVFQVAPQELPLFDPIYNQFAAKPGRVAEGGDIELGFGAGEIIALLTPAILAICADVSRYLVEAIGESLKERGKDVIAARLDAVFGKKRQKEPPTYTESQRAAIRDIVQKKARQLKLNADQAQLLADAIIGSLMAAEG